MSRSKKAAANAKSGAKSQTKPTASHHAVGYRKQIQHLKAQKAALNDRLHAGIRAHFAATERIQTQNAVLVEELEDTIQAQRTDAQRSAAAIHELQMTVGALQRELYELLLEKDEWQAHAPALDAQHHRNDPAHDQHDIDASAAAMRTENDALRATVAQLEQKISTDAQNFGGAVASLNAEIGRLHAELRATRERARDELEHAQELAKADLQHLAERSRCDQEKLRKLLTSIGSLVEDIAAP